MEFAELVELQRRFDERHGWYTAGGAAEEIVGRAAKDLVGLIGEIGEFANILKKIQLLESTPNEMANEFDQRRPELCEEIVDSLIYLIRISGHLDLDVENAFLDKIRRNEEKYRRFELKT